MAYGYSYVDSSKEAGLVTWLEIYNPIRLEYGVRIYKMKKEIKLTNISKKKIMCHYVPINLFVYPEYPRAHGVQIS